MENMLVTVHINGAYKAKDRNTKEAADKILLLKSQGRVPDNNEFSFYEWCGNIYIMVWNTIDADDITLSGFLSDDQ